MRIKERVESGELVAVEELEMSERSTNCLIRGGIETVNRLVDVGQDQLLSIHALGAKSLAEIKDVLADEGLALSETIGVKLEGLTLAAALDRMDRLRSQFTNVQSEIRSLRFYIRRLQSLQSKDGV